MDEDTVSTESSSHGHNFFIKTFTVPIKCYHCTSLMIGVERQGTVCEGLHLLLFILSISLSVFSYLLIEWVFDRDMLLVSKQTFQSLAVFCTSV